MNEGATAAVPGRVVLPDGTAAFYGARWKQVLAILGCVAFAAMAVGMLHASAPRYQTVYVRVVMVVGIVFFSACGVAWVLQLCFGGPRLVITANEVFVTSHFGRPKAAVRLEQIDHVVLCKAARNPYVAVVVKEDDPMMRGGRWPFIAETNRAVLGCAAVMSVPQVVLRTPLEEVARELSGRSGRPIVDLRLK